MKNFVIIGNSAAAVGCIEGIRSVDASAKIMVITDEPYHTYSRPLISYLLYGKTDLERMKYRPSDFYTKNNVELLAGETAETIDQNTQTVLLKSGRTVSYDKLLVATGSSPFVPEMPGLSEVKNKFSFMKLDDALELENALTPSSKVLIIGAGLIGLKCAEGILNKCVKITVVDLADRILPSILDNGGSNAVQKHLENKGIEFVLGSSAASLQNGKATLSSGEIVDFDVLVVAVGVRPNVSLVKNIGGDCGKAIITNNKQETSIKNIYAAGDCTQSVDITTGEQKVLALLPNAYLQGEVAGVNMAGGEAAYENAIPMNAIGFFGLHIITAGTYTGNVYENISDSCYKKLFYKNNTLKGYILIGDCRRAGIYTSLIQEQSPLDTIDFELIKDRPQLMAFSRGERAKRINVNL